jgi:hypothetical protein
MTGKTFGEKIMLSNNAIIAKPIAVRTNIQGSACTTSEYHSIISL